MRWIIILLCLNSGAVNAAFEQDDLNKLKAAMKLKLNGEYSKAIEELTPPFDTLPRGYISSIQLAWLHYLQGQHEKSREYYQLAVQFAPEAIEPRLGLLLPQLALKKWREAEQTAYQIIKHEPNNYLASLRLLYALRQQGKYILAQKHVEKLVKLYPGDISLLREQAMILDARGNQGEWMKLNRKIDALGGGVN